MSHSENVITLDANRQAEKKVIVGGGSNEIVLMSIKGK